MTAVKCPTCGNKVNWTREAKFKPFCSERCRMIDLGAWASDRYAISAESPAETDETARSEVSTKH